MRVLVVSEGGLTPYSGYFYRLVGCLRVLQNLDFETRTALILPVSRRLSSPRPWSDFRREAARLPTTVLEISILHKSLSTGLGFLNTRLAERGLNRTIRSFRPDLVHSHNVYPFLLASRPCADNHVPHVYDYHGAYAHEKAFLKGKAHSSALFQQWTQIEKKNLSNANGLLTVSHAATEFLDETFGPGLELPHAVVPCFFNRPFPPPDLPRDRVRAELGVQDRRVYLYMGNLLPWQQVEETVGLFRRLHARNPKSFLILLSPNRSQATDLVRKAGLDASDYLIRSCDFDEVPLIACAADMGFLLREPHVLNRVAFPTKYLDYLYSGVPVCSTLAVADVASQIRDHELGVLVEEPQADTTPEAICDYQDRFQRSVFLQQARRVLGDYTTKKMGERYSTLYKQVLSGGDLPDPQ